MYLYHPIEWMEKGHRIPCEHPCHTICYKSFYKISVHHVCLICMCKQTLQINSPHETQLFILIMTTLPQKHISKLTAGEEGALCDRPKFALNLH